MSALQDHHDERLAQLQDSYQLRLETVQRQLQIFQQGENAGASDDDQKLLSRLSALEGDLTAVRQAEEEANVQLRAKEKQIHLLNRQLEKLQADKSQKSPQIERKHDKPTFVESSIQTDDNQELSSANNELLDTIHRLEKLLWAKDDVIAELSSEKDNLDSSLVELDGQHQEEMDAILGVKDDLLASNKNISTNLEEVRRQNELLQIEVDTLREQLLVNTRARDSQDAREQDARLQAIVNQVNVITSENEKLEDKLKTSEDELLKLARVSRQKEETLLSAGEVTEKELSEMKLRVKELESMVLEKGDLASSNTAEFISGNPDANSMIQQMSSENENLQNEADDLRTKLRGNAREIDLLKMEIESIKIDNSKLREQLEQRNAVVEGLEDSLEKTEKTHAKKLAESDEQVLSLKGQLESLSKDEVGQPAVDSMAQTEDAPLQPCTNASQTTRVDEISSSSQTDAGEDINNDRTETLGMEVTIRELEEQVKTLAETRSSLTAENKTKDEVLSEKVSAITKLETELANQGSHLRELQNQFESREKATREEFESKRVESESLQSRLSRELEKWKDKANENETICQALNLDLDRMQSELERLEEESRSVEEKQERDQSEKSVIELRNVLRQKDAEIFTLNAKIQARPSTNDASHGFHDENSLEAIKTLEGEKDRLLTVLNEKSRECSGLKAEVHRLFGVVSAEKQALSKLQQDNQELSHQKPDETEKEMSKEAVHNLARIIKDKDLEIDALKQKNETLLAVMHQTDSGTTGTENIHLEKLMGEKDELMKKMRMYQSDREQITKLLNQKHQESLMYHAEMQKLNTQLSAERQKYLSLKEQHQSVSLLFEEKQKSLLNTQNEVVSLKQRVTELERHQVDLSNKYSGLIEQNSETVQVNKDEWTNRQRVLEDTQSKVKQYEELINEKDRMIYQLNHSLEETSLILTRKEENIKTLQHRLDEVSFKFSEAEMKLKETAEEGANSCNDSERLRIENEALQEENKSLTMSYKQSQFEKDSMKEKMSTLVQLVQENEGERHEMGRSTSSAQLLDDFATLEGKMGAITQERDQALLALNQQQQENKNQQRELKKLQEQNEKLHSELDRLRNHLLEIQDNYTQEIMAAEDREKTLRIKLASAEDRASLSSNAIANASMESQFRVDSLQQQLSQVLRQRDSALEQTSRLEDQIQQLKAAITNLQSALECIQGEHRRELIEASKASKEKLLLKDKEIDSSKAIITEQETRLRETVEALGAASRLSEQLDRKEARLKELQREVSEKQRLLQRYQDEIHQLESNSEGKVDKQIMKSLVLGYFSSPTNQKPEVVRLLARILDFNQIEMEKAGVRIGRDATPIRPSVTTPSRGGWISSFIGKVATSTPKPIEPPVSHSPTTTPSGADQSFSTLFVEFLKNESQPHLPARIPLEGSVSASSMISSTRKPLSNPSKSTVKLDFYSPSGGNLVSGPPAITTDHPLMRPLSTALPTFTPVLSSDGPSNKNSLFLEEVLK